LAHRGIDVLLADAAAAGQVGESLAQALTQAVEHAEARAPSMWRTGRRGADAMTSGWCAGSDAPGRPKCSAGRSRARSRTFVLLDQANSASTNAVGSNGRRSPA